MKYWKELNELDDAVYKVQAVNSGLQILGRTDEMTSANSEMPEEFQTFLADLSDRMDEAIRDLKNKFQNVWDVVRDDTFEENIAAIDDLEKDQADKIRFQKIVDGIQTDIVKDEVYLNIDDTITFDGAAGQPVYTVAGAMDDQFSFNFDNMNFEGSTFKLDDDLDLSSNVSSLFVSER